ncbi:hypothetical protein AADW59_00165 [Candidatus Hodgkinia cicadicola]
MLVQSLTFSLYLEHNANSLLQLRFETFIGFVFFVFDALNILVPWSSVPIANLALYQVFILSHSAFAVISSYKWPMWGGASVYIRDAYIL